MENELFEYYNSDFLNTFKYGSYHINSPSSEEQKQYVKALHKLQSVGIINIETREGFGTHILKTPSFHEAVRLGGLKAWIDKNDKEILQKKEKEKFETQLIRATLKSFRISKWGIVMTVIVSLMTLAVLIFQPQINNNNDDKLKLLNDEVIMLEKQINEMKQTENATDSLRSQYIDTLFTK